MMSELRNNCFPPNLRFVTLDTHEVYIVVVTVSNVGEKCHKHEM